jgi:hypothetical protein
LVELTAVEAGPATFFGTEGVTSAEADWEFFALVSGDPPEIDETDPLFGFGVVNCAEDAGEDSVAGEAEEVEALATGTLLITCAEDENAVDVCVSDAAVDDAKAARGVGVD